MTSADRDASDDDDDDTASVADAADVTHMSLLLTRLSLRAR